MSVLGYFVVLFFLTAVIEAIRCFADNRSNVQKDNFGKMKRRLLKLLKRDGYECEMKEGRVYVTCRQESFQLFFQPSRFGNQYTRVTVADYYEIEKIKDVNL